MADKKDQKTNTLEAEKMLQIRDLLLGSHIRETGSKIDTVHQKISESSKDLSEVFSKQMAEMKAGFEGQIQSLKSGLEGLIQEQIDQTKKSSQEKLEKAIKDCQDQISTLEKQNQSEVGDLAKNKVAKTQLSKILADLSERISKA